MLDSLIHLIDFLRPMALVKWLVFLLIPSVLWVVVHLQTLQNYFEAKDRLNDARENIIALEDTQAQLLHEKKVMQEGGFAAEKAARENFHVARPGETVILLDTPTSATTPLVAKPTPAPTPRPKAPPSEPLGVVTPRKKTHSAKH